MGGLRTLVGGLLAAVLVTFASPAVAGAFSDWAVVIVAGDFHAAGGMETEAFDNARRDVTAGLIARGFSAANIRQFSSRPERYSDPVPGPDEFAAFSQGLAEAAQTARGGCLIYFSSHGAPQGIVFGPGLLPPWALAQAINQACGQRPTVVVLSACFSGVFLEPLAAPNRMILTAARPDRTSFGCGVNNRYPYFDDCFLQVLPSTANFMALGPAVQTCVAQREIVEGMAPPSEPQFWVDPGFRPMLPMYGFSTPPPPRPQR